MKKSTWLIPVLTTAGIFGTGLFIFPLFTAAAAPDFGSTVAVRDARLALPPMADEPATIHSHVSNLGREVPIIVTGVALEHARAVAPLEPDGRVPLEIANAPVASN